MYKGKKMLKILFLSIFSTLLFSSNPIVYAQLGDVIYNNVQSIHSLKSIQCFKAQYKEIDAYVSKVDNTKAIGFAIENGNQLFDKKDYLQTLRTLSKKNDKFMRSANTTFVQSLENEDSKLFAQLVNSGLIDTKKYKKEILTYYYGHEEDMNVTDLIESYIEEDKKHGLSTKKYSQYLKAKKRKEKEKIHRIRKQDIYDQKRLEKKLNDEVKRKKQEIQKEKNKELFH